VSAPAAIVCRCAYARPVPAARVDGIVRELAASGAEAIVVDDLCALAARRDPRLAEWAARPGARLFACQPRAVRSLLRAAGLEPPAGLDAVNLRDGAAPAAEPAAAPPDGWLPWFPAIDRERCTGCRQCLGFCLFGVYEPDAGGGVRVTRPEQCKPNCPACARICPAAAIVFPKCPESPIDGAPIVDEEAIRERARAAREGLPGGDLRAVLAERRRRARPALVDRERLAAGATAAPAPSDAARRGGAP